MLAGLSDLFTKVLKRLKRDFLLKNSPNDVKYYEGGHTYGGLVSQAGFSGNDMCVTGFHKYFR